MTHQRMKRTIGIVAGAVAVAMAMSGCVGTPPKGEPGQASDTFTYANGFPLMSSWDPALAYDNESIALGNIYEQLTHYDSETNEVTPLLATSWEASEDGLTWTFQLQPDVQFSTGRELTADAVKTAIERTIELQGGPAYIWDPVESITTVDTHTLVFQLTYPAPIDLIASSNAGAYIYDTEADAGDLTAWFEKGQAAGTGPYLVTEWKQGQEFEVALAANESYWRGWSGKHYQRVIIRHVPQVTTAIQLLKGGQVSFVPDPNVSLFETLESDPNIRTSSAPSMQNLVAMLNTKSGPLADVNLRRAVQQAIDYEGIVEALQGKAAPAHGYIPEGLLGYSEDVAFDFDPQSAAKLVTAAGFGPSKPLVLRVSYRSNSSELDTVISVMKSNLADVGITLDARPNAWPTQWDMGKSADESQRQDIFMVYWYPDYADPFSWFISLFHSEDEPFFNMSYLANAQIDAAIDEVSTITATDRELAATKYVELQKMIMAEAAAPVLFVNNYQRVLSTTVSGYVDNPVYPNVVFVYDLQPVG